MDAGCWRPATRLPMLVAEAAWGEAMGLFNLFGGKRKDEAKTAEPVTRRAKAEGHVAHAAAPVSGSVTPIAPAVSGSGSAQVKLRLKLAASLRSGEHAEAYKAAKDLAAIQAKAGRRVGARRWRTEAERILTECEMPA